MPQTHPPASSSSPPPSPSCLCPACGKPMRLVAAEPYTLYTNLDLHNYACECGETEERFVRRE